MNDNPYSKILEMMRYQGSKYNPPSIMLGEVINPPPSLIIKTAGIQILKDNILIADYLLADYTRKIKIPTVSANGNTTEESIVSIGIDDGVIKFTDTLKVGDILAVMPTDDRQTYIVLCKVVSL